MKTRAFTAAAVLLLCAAAVYAEGKLAVVTVGEGGLREGDKLYAVGSPIADFKRDFGPPEKDDAEAYDYPGDGVRAFFRDGVITGFVVFFADGAILDTKYKAAKDATTDKGLKAGATYREIVKAHGEPVRKSEYGETLRLNYPWGQIQMEGGTIRSVSVRKSEG